MAGVLQKKDLQTFFIDLKKQLHSLWVFRCFYDE